ncbi:glycoside hydrolase family 32 protein [Pseudochryseolinea flava]|uniref:Glycoside hydrolase family 32 protein n=1 Tax=Pseudochryseolinea flava TaxID=2059302 RepID=A0A364Y271_9BACT|nr:glycoside hydrolase family 32 protein [Pseudochryseolinea flava]RAW00973.1 glycoside hydrolase family 32 protein [Pseudochryseolinea flava]
MKSITKLAFVSVALLLVSCKDKSQATSENSDTTKVDTVMHEAYRPQLHFSPKEKWMNDPNGMFFLDGEYHLFYQYFPGGTKWGPMHWGHAVSKDLIHWEHLPIALYPDSTGYIFSGSAVVDHHNTSGLAKNGEIPIVAYYTIHDDKKAKAGRVDYQTQAMAYSLDKGRTWTKYDQNPAISNPGIIDFRDPKVSWNSKSKQWVMTLAVKDHISFYGSTNLKQWKKLSDFGLNEGDHGGVWECPDLLTMKDEHGVEKNVLIVSINPGGPNRGSATQYFVGDFDGKTFKNDTPGKNSGWVDYGPDNYAGVTFNNIPKEDGRCIMIGWMSNWFYAELVPTEKWRSAMTIPRVLTLRTIGKNHVVQSLPVVEIEETIESTGKISTREVDTLDITAEAKVDVRLSRIQGRIKKANFVFELSNAKGEKILFGLDDVGGKFFVDRSASGKVNFHPDFKLGIQAPRVRDSEWVEFTAIVDVASIELFFDQGATVMTAIYFPNDGYSKLKLYGKNGKVSTDAIVVDELKTIW